MDLSPKTDAHHDAPVEWIPVPTEKGAQYDKFISFGDEVDADGMVMGYTHYVPRKPLMPLFIVAPEEYQTKGEDRMSRVLIITVGLPLSGKDAWAPEQGYPVVSPNAIRLAMTGQAFSEYLDDYIWAITHTMIRSLFLAGHNIVIVNVTSNTKRRRDDWKSLVDSIDDCRIAFKVFDDTSATCIAAAKRDHQEKWIPMIQEMAEDHESLTIEELELAW